MQIIFGVTILAALIGIGTPIKLLGQGINEYPRWSPDGSRIVFQSTRDGNFEIYMMNADGSDQKRLTNNLYSDQFPTWSADGKQIAFSSMATGATHSIPGLSAIFVMDADGKNRNRITNQKAGNDRPTVHYHDMYPTWSPDGKKIAYLSDEAGGWREIYTVNPDGTERTQITFHRSHHWNLVWTPDSKRIIFDFREDGFPFAANSPKWGIYSIDVSNAWYDWGDDLQVLANKTESEVEYDCVISPDAKKIGYHLAHNDPAKYNGYAGMAFGNLSSAGGVLTVDESSLAVQSREDQYWADWSPDGSMIAFTSVRTGSPQIYVMNADGSRVKRLTGE